MKKKKKTTIKHIQWRIYLKTITSGTFMFSSHCSKYCVDLYGAAIHSNFYHSLMYVKVNNNINNRCICRVYILAFINHFYSNLIKIYSIRSCREVTAILALMALFTQLLTLPMKMVSELKEHISLHHHQLLHVKHLVLDLNKSIFLLIELPVFQK